MYAHRFTAAGFLSIALALLAFSPAASAGLSFEDLRNIVTVRSPQIAPSGARIAYIRSRVNWAQDRNDSTLMLLDVASDSVRELTRGRRGVAEPRWSPAGTRLAYLAAPDARQPAQIFVLRMDGGDSEQITHAKRGVLSYVWRPDASELAYVTEDEPANAKAIARHLDAVVITDEDYLTREAQQPAHLWLVNVDGSSARQLTTGVASVVKDAAPVWSADSKYIFYQRQPDAIFAHFPQQTTFEFDVAAKTEADLGIGVDESPIVSHGGSMLAVATPRHGTLYLQKDLSLRTLPSGRETGSSRSIDRNVHWAAWMPGDAGLAFAASDGVRNGLWTLSKDSSARRVDLGDVDFGPDASVASNGAVAFVGQTQTAPSEIYYLPPEGGAPRRLTNENAWITTRDVGRSEARSWMTDTGASAVGVLTYPPGYQSGKKYPLVLEIHGGPVSTSTWNFSGFTQVLAARGYLVFQPNYRGSDNLGDAFLQSIVGDVTSGPGKDNLAAVAMLRSLGIVDESRIFVSGWSGGGLQTSWLIGHATFWRAAVSGAAVNDWYQQAVLADINEDFGRAFFNGVTPFSKAGRLAYAFESPLSYVEHIRTPTLILSDNQDQRVPVSQSFMFYHALRDRGVPVRFTEIPRYGHFPSDPAGREIAYRAWADWFDRWMK